MDRSPPSVPHSAIRIAAVVLAATLGLASCSDAAEPDARPAESSTTASRDDTTTTTAPPEVPTVRQLVQRLASDELEGRDNGSDGSEVARRILVDELATFAEPVFPGADGYLQPFADGVNVLGMIPGDPATDEVVVIGAHYDHLGPGACGSDPDRVDDTICNGATDNATGVAVALEAARSLAAGEGPRRSVIVAFWDAEEDGLLGSRAYVADPVAPLADTVAYVNLDIQGSVLTPSLRSATFAIGAETGGDVLADAIGRAAKRSDLQIRRFSLVFGQGRSDHAAFAQAGVPVVFFSDVSNGCYHTVRDDIDAVDFDKLDQEVDSVSALLDDLATGDDSPRFVADAPLVDFSDAVTLRDVVAQAGADLDLLGPEAATDAGRLLLALDEIVDRGPGVFGDDDIGVVLAGAAGLVAALDDSECAPAG